MLRHLGKSGRKWQINLSFSAKSDSLNTKYLFNTLQMWVGRILMSWKVPDKMLMSVVHQVVQGGLCYANILL
jgi:hypothetical protein